MGLKLNGTPHLLVCTQIHLGDNTFTIKRNTEAQTDDRKEFGLEIDTDKIKYVLMSRHQ
jgi:hypothetical protein